MFYRLVIVAFAFALVACDRAPAQETASVTVKLPPPHPYVPRPGFSIGGTVGEDAPAPPTEVDG